jgi:hypothetical protein
MTRETSDLIKVKVLIFELEFRIAVQQDIINAFASRGLGQAEPIVLLAQLQNSLRHAHVARDLLVQRTVVSSKPVELVEVSDQASIQPKLVEGLLPDAAHYVSSNSLS